MKGDESVDQILKILGLWALDRICNRQNGSHNFRTSAASSMSRDTTVVCLVCPIKTDTADTVFPGRNKSIMDLSELLNIHLI